MTNENDSSSFAFSPLQAASASTSASAISRRLRVDMERKPSKEIRRGNISLMAAVETQIRENGHSRHIVEALAVRLDRARGLVEVDPLDAEARDEHGRGVEVRLLAMGDLADPV